MLLVFHPQREVIPGISCAQHPPLTAKGHFQMEIQHIPCSQIIHRVWEPGLGGAAGAGSAVRHLHVPMALREKWPKPAQTPPPSPIKLGFYPCPIYPWDKCLLQPLRHCKQGAECVWRALLHSQGTSMNTNNTQGMDFSCTTPQVSIPQAGEALPVSLQQQNFPIATSTPWWSQRCSGSWDCWLRLNQSPVPITSPCRAPRAALGRLWPKLKVVLVSAECPSQQGNK